MKIKRKRRFIVSKALNILRAFVDGIIVVDDDVFVSVAYRKGRAFCRYDKNFNLKYRIEEENLAVGGFGDFRDFTVDRQGNLILAGLIRPDVVTLFIINGNGRIARTSHINDFPLPESIAVDSDDNIYLHSPLKEAPVYQFSPELEEMGPIGEFPPGEDGITRKMAQLAVDNDGNLTAVFENAPAYIYQYSKKREQVFSKEMASECKSIDFITQALDISMGPENGFLYILKQMGDKKSRIVEIINKSGEKIDELRVPGNARRIHLAKGNLLFSSGTLFGIGGMLLSGGIYGAITTIDVFKIED